MMVGRRVLFCGGMDRMCNIHSYIIHKRYTVLRRRMCGAPSTCVYLKLEPGRGEAIALRPLALGLLLQLPASAVANQTLKPRSASRSNVASKTN